MILQIVVGALVARKLMKAYKKAQDLKDLKDFGESISIPYVPGEDIEAYRKLLLETRNNDASNQPHTS